ncbi:MAG: hypothetical protein KH317_00765 [Clostridiales bacterium]|jgi:hypothetical protein|nr:hypothetical protein [Clostridiales bacterium]DAU21659.1 MAG TPA: hypothetical protein [Caudoviricetes sp.]
MYIISLLTLIAVSLIVIGPMIYNFRLSEDGQIISGVALLLEGILAFITVVLMLFYNA